MTEPDTSIFYCIEELDHPNEPPLNIDALLADLDTSQEWTVPRTIHYIENCTVKELLTICDYYGFAKDLKTHKCNKEQIVECLVAFETDPINADIVFKRQNAWFYIHELKQDKFMKKFVLW